MLLIDRFEGSWAVIEYGKKTFNLPRALLPENAKEGDLITMAVTIDQKGTMTRRKAADKLAGSLFEE
ncbi:MAG TPA: DUF3006 domain-containing protein [Desulfotomaculum sp.]|nr:MAG: Uncharacterized protein XD84_1674 [Desulfotomaculum sp. 46_80]HAG10273.1 DUF3006 domain-containing protein [Desulfotomaculum sp.]HBY03323.1 DUF3006 domain-containing protein [Desulfotomaculum sp.]